MVAFARHIVEIAMGEWCSIDFDGDVSVRGGRAGVESRSLDGVGISLARVQLEQAARAPTSIGIRNCRRSQAMVHHRTLGMLAARAARGTGAAALLLLAARRSVTSLRVGIDAETRAH
jgi:hypothetical protein